MPSGLGLVNALGPDVERVPVHEAKMGEPGLDEGLVHDVLVLVVAQVL